MKKLLALLVVAVTAFMSVSVIGAAGDAPEFDDTTYACTDRFDCCSNGIDDDGDGQADADDVDCAIFQKDDGSPAVAYNPEGHYMTNRRAGTGGSGGSTEGNGGTTNMGGNGAPESPKTTGGPQGTTTSPSTPIDGGIGMNGGIRWDPDLGPGGSCVPSAVMRTGGGFVQKGQDGTYGVDETTSWACAVDGSGTVVTVTGGFSYDQMTLNNGKVVWSIQESFNEDFAVFRQNFKSSGVVSYLIPADPVNIVVTLRYQEAANQEDATDPANDFLAVEIFGADVTL